jgi:hypothetical protein
MPPFWLQVASIAGVQFGEIHHATGYEQTDPLDAAGTWSATVPAAHPSVAYIADNRVVHCNTPLSGDAGGQTEIGSGIINTISATIDAANPTGLLTIGGSNRMRELTYSHVGSLLVSDGAGGPTTSGIAQIFAMLTDGDWAYDANETLTSKAIMHQFQDETVLEALVWLAQATGDHFVAWTGKSLAWMHAAGLGDCGLRAFLPMPSPDEMTNNPTACAIVSIIPLQDSHETHIGRLYARGKGSGASPLRLSDSTVTTGLPAGWVVDDLGGKGHYLEHTATWNAYHIEKVMKWPDVETEATLLEVAYEWMKRQLVTPSSYRIQVAGTKMVIRPGMTIYVSAHCWAGNYQTINIEQDLYITEVWTSIDQAGVKTITLTCSTTDKRILRDADIIARSMIQSRQAYTHSQA